MYKQNLCLYRSFFFDYSGAPANWLQLRNHIDSLYSCSSLSESQICLDSFSLGQDEVFFFQRARVRVFKQAILGSKFSNHFMVTVLKCSAFGKYFVSGYVSALVMCQIRQGMAMLWFFSFPTIIFQLLFFFVLYFLLNRGMVKAIIFFRV